MPEQTPAASAAFGQTLHRFLGHALAIARGETEGGPFGYFLASEYLWEMQAWATDLLKAPTDRLTPAARDALQAFRAATPGFLGALKAARDQRGGGPVPPAASARREWIDWEALSTLPAWQALARQAAALPGQLEPSAGPGGSGASPVTAAFAPDPPAG